MTISAKYFHDRWVLLLLSCNVFLALAVSLFVILQLSAGKSTGGSLIVQCRDCSNPAAVDRFTPGSIIELVGFVLFALLVLAIHLILSMRTYHIHRPLSVAILALGVLLLVLTFIVSNALLVLR